MTFSLNDHRPRPPEAKDLFRIELAILSDCGGLSRVLVYRPVHQLPATDGLRKRDPHRRLRIR
jgi:hypothetical protein